MYKNRYDMLGSIGALSQRTRAQAVAAQEAAVERLQGQVETLGTLMAETRRLAQSGVDTRAIGHHGAASLRLTDIQ